MIADKEAEITVTLLLYEVCRKYYEVQGSYVEITLFRILKTSTAVVCCWSYIYPFGNCWAREGPIELNKLFRISQMSKGSVTDLLFTFSSFMTLLYNSVNLQSVLW